jgi:hypothetical protein
MTTNYRLALGDLRRGVGVRTEVLAHPVGGAPDLVLACATASCTVRLAYRCSTVYLAPSLRAPPARRRAAWERPDAGRCCGAAPTQTLTAFLAAQDSCPGPVGAAQAVVGRRVCPADCPQYVLARKASGRSLQARKASRRRASPSASVQPWSTIGAVTCGLSRRSPASRARPRVAARFPYCSTAMACPSARANPASSSSPRRWRE